MIRYFSPHLERLEVRRLLAADMIERMTLPADAVMADEAMAGDVAVDDGMADDLAVDLMAMAIAMSADWSPVSVSVEQHEDGMLVVVGVAEAGHSPHHVSVIGGQSAWTDADGYARFQIPSGTRLLELEIANDQGLNAATIQLKFDDSGRLVSQIWEVHDELMGEGESDKLASMIGSLFNHDAHANMALDMPAMTMDDHQVVHVPGASAAMVVSHSTTHAFDFAVTRNRMSDHSPATPNAAAARANSSDDASGSAIDDSGSTGSAEHGGAGGSANPDGAASESHQSDAAGDEPAWESASFAGNELAAVSPSSLAAMIAEDVVNAPNRTVAATFATNQTPPQTPPPTTPIEASGTTGTRDTIGKTEDASAEPATLSNQASSQDGRTWFAWKIAATSLLSAAAAVFFERRAHIIARKRRQTAQNPRVE